jgi:hypothetical protein
MEFGGFTMEMAMNDKALLGNYLGLISNLSRESKIKLVESLNAEIRKDDVSETGWIDKLYGSFISDNSAEAMITEIRADRQFSHEIAGFFFFVPEMRSMDITSEMSV